MSASLWLEGEDKHVPLCDMTYNLTPMLTAAGLPSWDCFAGMEAQAAGWIFARARDNLMSDRARFEALEPANGWGTYWAAVEQLSVMADRCKESPRLRVGAWL